MHNFSCSTKTFTKYSIHIWPEDDDEDGDVISAWNCLCLCRDESSGAGAIYPYPDSLGPRFNFNDFLCMAKYEFSSRTCQNNSLHPTTYWPILSAVHTSLDYTSCWGWLVPTMTMNLESKRIWFRLKSEEYIIIDTVNEAWAAAYNCMELYGLHRWRTETRNIFDSLFSIWWKDRTQILSAEPLILQIFIGDDKVFVSFDKDFSCYFTGVAVCWCKNCWPGWWNRRRW